jgi:hypothetical protein
MQQSDCLAVLKQKRTSLPASVFSTTVIVLLVVMVMILQIGSIKKEEKADVSAGFSVWRWVD